jgi:hypothetical protein
MLGMLMNYESERIWKEAVMAYIVVISEHLPGRTEDKRRKLDGV